jgi:hypothetical protein
MVKRIFPLKETGYSFHFHQMFWIKTGKGTAARTLFQAKTIIPQQCVAHTAKSQSLMALRWHENDNFE